MKFLNFGLISKNIALLIILAIFPAMAILFYSGIEERRQAIARAEKRVLLLTHGMAEAEKEITLSTKQILSTLSVVPAIKNLDIQASNAILSALLELNRKYHNIALIDLNGRVLAAGRTFGETNLSDRKHVREALITKQFAVGEYIISRVGTKAPAFAFAYPVLSKEGTLKAILTAAVKLNSFTNIYDSSTLPDKSFVAITDHQGIRLFYYPAQEKTNPIGAPIRANNWQNAIKAKETGMFASLGSDDIRRIFAFDKVRLAPEKPPYLYAWAGIPEDNIIAPADAILFRNLLLMIFIALVSLCVSWLIGKKTLISPIQSLVDLTRKFAQGNLDARSQIIPKTGELEVLTTAFHEMADALSLSQRIVRENETRFRLLLDSLDAFIYVADMETYEILFVNEYAKQQLGDVTGKKCWQSIQQGQNGPCSFCINKWLNTEEGKPGGLYKSENRNTITGKWLYKRDRLIEWTDGRTVRLQIATDISERKKIEEEREQLIAQLEESLAKIKTLSGFLPICSSCKKIRDDKGYWNEVEVYVRDHSEAEFSHGMCPDCLKKIYPELYPELYP